MAAPARARAVWGCDVELVDEAGFHGVLGDAQGLGEVVVDADGHDVGWGFEPGPLEMLGGGEGEVEVDFGVDVDAGVGFAVAHGGVDVADGEEGVGRPDGQMNGGSGGDVVEVEVAAVDAEAEGFDSSGGGGDAEGADHGADGQGDAGDGDGLILDIEGLDGGGYGVVAEQAGAGGGGDVAAGA